MRKLLEINNTEEYKRSLLTQIALGIITIALCIFVRTHDRNFFDIDFIVELIIVTALFRFYVRAFRNKNYAYWGISVLIGLYLLRHILHFTFIEYNIFILYIGFLGVIFLVMNSFVMSSPLYYPRVQWWEYDFRYRGDLKAIIKVGTKQCEARLIDLRRGCTSLETFEYLSLGDEVETEVLYGSKIYSMTGVIKTLRLLVPGRPYRYGIKLNFDETMDKKTFLELKKIWKLNKKVKLRRKFTELKK